MTGTRRDFVASGLALTAGISACARGRAPATEPEDRYLIELTATQAVAMLRRGEITAERYAGALLARCAALRHLNAFISLEPQRVLEAARAADLHRASSARLGPLHGLPVPIKDSVNTRDYPTTAGTPALRHFQPSADAAVVRQLREAGAIVMGKTNIHELSFGWTSSNLAFGAVRNPYDPDRIPGGSSGGTAAAIAARMAPLGIAEDTQGSIRVPAALCGICGFRPTTGRYSNEGVVPITPLFDQVGPHARSVRDLELLDTVLAKVTGTTTRPSLRGVRLGLDRHYFYRSVDLEVAQITSRALDRLQDAGALLVEAPVPGLAELVERTTAPVQLYDVMPQLIAYLERYDAGITFGELLAQASADIHAIFSTYVVPGGSGSVPESVFTAARDAHVPALRRTLAAWFREHGVAAMVFPATRIPATPIGEQGDVLVDGRTVSFQAAIARNISPGSTAGLPGLVLPAGLTAAGLPVGIELDGPAGSDRTLLALGEALEPLLGALPPPPV